MSSIEPTADEVKNFNKYMNVIVALGQTLKRSSVIKDMRVDVKSVSVLLVGWQCSFEVKAWFLTCVTANDDEDLVLQLEINETDCNYPISITIDRFDRIKINALKSIIKSLVADGTRK